MEKQDYSLTFRKILPVFVAIFVIFMLQATGNSAFSEELKLLKLGSVAPKRWSAVEAVFSGQGKSVTVVQEGQLYQEQPDGVLVIPLTENLYHRTNKELQSYVLNGGRLILIPPESYPKANTIALLEWMGFHVSGSTVTENVLQLKWFEPAITLDDTLPIGSSVLLVQPDSSTQVSAVWQGEGLDKPYPAVIRSRRGTLMNWLWGGRDLTQKTSLFLLKQALAEVRNPVIVEKPLPPIKDPEPIKEPPTSVNSSTFTLMEKPPTPLASTDASAPLPGGKGMALPKPEQPQPAAKPESPIEESATVLPPVKIPPAEVQPIQTKPEDGERELPAVPAESLKPKTSTDMPSSTTSDTEPSTPSQAAPAQEKSMMIPAPSPAAEASGTREKTSEEAGEKETDFMDDPLFNDELMGGQKSEDDPGLITAVPYAPTVATSFDLGSYLERVQRLDEYRTWVEDAIDASLQLSIPIPIKKAQQLLLKADIQKAASEAAYQKGRTWEGEYAYEEAYQLMNQALVLTALSSKIEGRAIWLDRGSIVDSKNEKGLRKLIGKLDKAGINVVYFESINAGFPVYPSELVKQNPLTEGWDPLAVAVDEAHKRGMELHAWVWTFAVGNTKHNPLIGKTADYAGPVLDEAGLLSEALRTSSGSIMPPRQTEYWVSPASPKGREFIKSVYQEIVTHYDVDGLHMDYIRYPFQRPSSQVGYEDVSRQRYHQETGMSVSGKGDYNLKSFVAWKTLQVNTFVKEVSEGLKAIKPDLKLSAAVFPMKRTQRILAIQQDWETWISKGWVDTLSPMIYTSSRSLFRSTVSRIIDSADQNAIVYPGVAIFRLDPDEMLGHLEAIRENGGMGSTLFAYAHLDTPKQEALRDGPYKVRNAIPPHQNPLQAIQVVVKQFQQNFNRLADKGELGVLTQAEIETLRKNLSDLQNLADTLREETEHKRQLSSETLMLVRSATRALEKNTQTWLQEELRDRPYRAKFFAEYVIRIRLLLDYTEKQYHINAETASEEPSAQL